MRPAKSAARTSGVADVSQKGKVEVGGRLQLVNDPASMHSVGSAWRWKAPVPWSKVKAWRVELPPPLPHFSSARGAPPTGYSAVAHMPRA